MMMLTAYEEQYLCDKAVKGSDFIQAFLDGDNVLDHSGISDFAGYHLTDEQGQLVEFADPEPVDDKMETAIRAVITALANSGNISPISAEGVISRAIEIVHE